MLISTHLPSPEGRRNFLKFGGTLVAYGALRSIQKASQPAYALTTKLQQVRTRQKRSDCTSPYTVVSGDTLSGISQKELGNANDWQEIQQANNLQGTAIYPGEKLIIPCPGLPQPETSPTATVTNSYDNSKDITGLLAVMTAIGLPLLAGIVYIAKQVGRTDR